MAENSRKNEFFERESIAIFIMLKIPLPDNDRRCDTIFQMVTIPFSAVEDFFHCIQKAGPVHIVRNSVFRASSV